MWRAIRTFAGVAEARTRATVQALAIATALVVAAAGGASAQALFGGNGPPPFRSLRYDENWSQLSAQAKRTRPWHDLKWIELGPGRVLTLGGDVRWRVERQDEPGLDLTGLAADTILAQRIMIHGDLRLGPQLRLFAQLGAHDALGRDSFFPFDDNRFDLQQVFLDGSLKLGEVELFGRAGRQEIFLSPWFTAPRDGVNIRLRYDAVRLWATRGNLRLDLVGGRPVNDRPLAFDDDADDGQELFAVRAAYSFKGERPPRLSLTYYENHRDLQRFVLKTGKDRRKSLGLRIEFRPGRFDLDTEWYWQWGRFADEEVRAFGGAGEAAWRFGDLLTAPKLGLRFLAGSGDERLGDGKTGVFGGPVGRALCCLDNLSLGSANILSLGPFFQFRPVETIVIDLKTDVSWRLEAGDAITFFPNLAYPGTRGREGDDLIALAPALTADWRPVPELTFSVGAMRTFVQGALKASGAEDQTFVLFMMSGRI